MRLSLTIALVDGTVVVYELPDEQAYMEKDVLYVTGVRAHATKMPCDCRFHAFREVVPDRFDKGKGYGERPAVHLHTEAKGYARLLFGSVDEM